VPRRWFADYVIVPPKRGRPNGDGDPRASPLIVFIEIRRTMPNRTLVIVTDLPGLDSRRIHLALRVRYHANRSWRLSRCWIMNMPGSTISVFGEPAAFRTAMRANGVVTLVASGGGVFSARLARISLHRMRLFAGAEQHSRVASVSIRSGWVRVSLPAEPASALIWDGIRTQPNEITTHNERHRFNEQTDGACRWNTIWLRVEDLARAGETMTGCTFVVPPGECHWQPTPESLRLLVSLHGNAIRATAIHGKLPAEREAAHGLEQQLLFALIECLVEKPPIARVPSSPGTGTS
jgi:hypothetical protein